MLPNPQKIVDLVTSTEKRLNIFVQYFLQDLRKNSTILSDVLTSHTSF